VVPHRTSYNWITRNPDHGRSGFPAKVLPPRKIWTVEVCLTLGDAWHEIWVEAGAKKSERRRNSHTCWSISGNSLKRRVSAIYWCSTQRQIAHSYAALNEARRHSVCEPRSARWWSGCLGMRPLRYLHATSSTLDFIPLIVRTTTPRCYCAGIRQDS